VARGRWERRFDELEREARDLLPGSREAIRALISLVLVDLARLLHLDPAYFARHFRRAHGASARAYRKRLQ